MTFSTCAPRAFFAVAPLFLFHKFAKDEYEKAEPMDGHDFGIKGLRVNYVEDFAAQKGPVGGTGSPFFGYPTLIYNNTPYSRFSEEGAFAFLLLHVLSHIRHSDYDVAGLCLGVVTSATSMILKSTINRTGSIGKNIFMGLGRELVALGLGGLCSIGYYRWTVLRADNEAFSLCTSEQREAAIRLLKEFQEQNKFWRQATLSEIDETWECKGYKEQLDEMKSKRSKLEGFSQSDASSSQDAIGQLDRSIEQLERKIHWERLRLKFWQYKDTFKVAENGDDFSDFWNPRFSKRIQNLENARMKAASVIESSDPNSQSKS